MPAEELHKNIERKQQVVLCQSEVEASKKKWSLPPAWLWIVPVLGWVIGAIWLVARKYHNEGLKPRGPVASGATGMDIDKLREHEARLIALEQARSTRIPLKAQAKAREPKAVIGKPDLVAVPGARDRLLPKVAG